MTAENPLNHLLQAYVEAALPILTPHPLPLTQEWQGTIDPGGEGFSAFTVTAPDDWSHVTRVEPHLIDLPETDALLQAIRRDDQLQSAFLPDGPDTLRPPPEEQKQWLQNTHLTPFLYDYLDRKRTGPPTFQPSTYDDPTERTRWASRLRRDGRDRRGDWIHGAA
jgi:hypothetical protein